MSRLLIVLALASTIGLHWAFLQSLAWMGMVVSYSHEAPLREALAKTFDGEHPCKLCKEIAKGKQSEKKSEAAPTGQKFDFLYSGATFVFASPSHGWETRWLDVAMCSLARTPPVPPPRQLPG